MARVAQAEVSRGLVSRLKRGIVGRYNPIAASIQFNTHATKYQNFNTPQAKEKIKTLEKGKDNFLKGRAFIFKAHYQPKSQIEAHISVRKAWFEKSK